MYKRVTVLLMIMVLVSCKNDKQVTSDVSETETEETAYTSVGAEIVANDAIAASRMAKHYDTMKAGDTIPSKMIAKVEEVCQAKGCWMKLDLENGEQVMVKFKDYGFFMPKDIAGQEVIINGKAFVNEMSVDEQQHYAEDAGKSAEEVAAITTPKRTYSFEADGVLLKQ
jgi:hypothetical protein